MNNPFSIAFGREPTQIVARDVELTPIYESFAGNGLNSDSYIITGPRGSGKTVALSRLIDHYRDEKDWIVSRLNISDNMLEQLASKLYEEGKVKKLFLKPEFSFSFQGVTFSLGGDKPVTSVESFLSKIFAYLKKKGIKVLIAIDDVAPSEELNKFIRAFQGFIIDHYDLKMVLTGLYGHVTKLTKVDSITFLARAPKINLKPLQLTAVAASYTKIFSISPLQAAELAKLTCGYAFGYQALGNILFNEGKKCADDAVLEQYDALLFNMAYEFIWSETTQAEKEIMKAIAKGFVSSSSLAKTLKVEPNWLSTYKKRLEEKGILNDASRGQYQFLLPRFKEFVLLRAMVE